MKTAPAVAEIQGLYGPFSFPEKLLQKIWLRGDFERARAFTTDGLRLSVSYPGRWNLLGGPDFLGARLRLGDGPEITGDVELHLRSADWAAHAHARDRAYDNVVLHVVLFPPPREAVTTGAGGRTIPMLALLPLLHHDLEEFAAEEAVETLAGRAERRIPDELATLEPAELAAQLRVRAADRWRQKVHFAKLRIERLGWEAACHQTALEILGYRFNRAPMLRVAGRWPCKQWTAGMVAWTDAFASEAGGWQLQGVRPANHPRTRLRQYAAWSRARPDWPQRLAAGAADWPNADLEGATAAVRRAHGFAALREKFADLTGDEIGGTRLDNLVADGFLPLLAAFSPQDDKARAIWYHWFPGDQPAWLTRALRQLGVCGGSRSPLAFGPAQGLLGWWLAHATSL